MHYFREGLWQFLPPSDEQLELLAGSMYLNAFIASQSNNSMAAICYRTTFCFGHLELVFAQNSTS